MSDREQIGLRVPSVINEKLQKKADEIGVSKNDVILMLINIGLTACESGFNLRDQRK